MERIRETFNDGAPFELVKQTVLRNASRVRIGSEEKTFARLHFRKMMMRDSDSYALGEAISSKVSLKVKTMFHPIVKKELKNKYFIKLGSDKYNIIYTDYDAYYCYFYLERIGSGGREATSEQDERDASDET